MEKLEAVLRGFRPHPPSPKVRAALFGDTPLPASEPAAEPAAPAIRHLWFGPLAAAAALLLSLATAWSPGPVAVASPLALAGRPGAWDPTLVQVQRNTLPRPSFRSTTGAGVASSFGSLLLRQTNALVR